MQNKINYKDLSKPLQTIIIILLLGIIISTTLIIYLTGTLFIFMLSITT